MKSIKDKKIVLIGGAGFIGHNLALVLKGEGADVSVIDSLQVNNLLTFAANRDPNHDRDFYYRVVSRRLELLHEAGVALQIEDARNYHMLSQSLGHIRPDIVIHLAAVAHAGNSNKDPYSTFDHSLRTLENALDYCRNNDVEQFVYFSSSMVYGNFKQESVDEETVCEPLGIYGALKYSGEKIVIGYNQVFNLPFTIVRPSALYGPGCVSRRVGQIFIENALKGLQVKINGDGSDKLDFTYIEDLVQGITRIVQNEKAKNQIFNLTYGQSRSIKDMADIVADHFPGTRVVYLPKDKLMPERGTLSVDKAKNLLGYEPVYSLEKGLARYIDWYKQITENIPHAGRYVRQES